MTESKKMALIEGLLFINGDSGVDINDMCFLIDQNEEEVKQVISELTDKYNNDDASGITIQNFAKTQYRMITKKEDAEQYKKLATVKTEAKLSGASLETLSIIAYKGPISRPEIEEIRGVNCENVIYKLKTRDLIREAGQSSRAGKPMNFEVTDNFMKYFNINSLDELPSLDTFNEEQKNLFE
ncbi:hypothetical protein Zmor_011978 [Zophobas morio]|uniref:Segregation and condensation protein B n=1 Tax=Zophobas morio TaxID=2755281 RepID=A0AA38HG38_9CUCU|nr:hypothetical protein Zmor_011978 [Zophobas morio]